MSNAYTHQTAIRRMENVVRALHDHRSSYGPNYKQWRDKQNPNAHHTPEHIKLLYAHLDNTIANVLENYRHLQAELDSIADHQAQDILSVMTPNLEPSLN